MRFAIGAVLMFEAIGAGFIPALAQSRFEASVPQMPYDPKVTTTYQVDEVGRILAVSNRRPIACPKQTEKTAVLLVAGQSNVANYAKSRFRTKYPTRAVNFFDGKCFSAASPLIGADGRGGESWTPLADKLIDAGIFDQVVIVTAGIGSSVIDRWREGGDLNQMLLGVVKSVRPTYRITHILWHQGESDLVAHTSTDDYIARFSSLLASLRKAGVQAPIYVSVASKCGTVEGWNSEDPVTTAQRRLVDPSAGILAGPDTNALVTPDDRYQNCHFIESGQQKFAGDWVRILRANALKVPSAP